MYILLVPPSLYCTAVVLVRFYGAFELSETSELLAGFLEEAVEASFFELFRVLRARNDPFGTSHGTFKSSRKERALECFEPVNKLKKSVKTSRLFALAVSRWRPDYGVPRQDLRSGAGCQTR